MEAAASEDLLEQKVHELDARLRQMKEERDQVVADNDDLQEQLDMTNTMRDAGMQKIGELKVWWRESSQMWSLKKKHPLGIISWFADV